MLFGARTAVELTMLPLAFGMSTVPEFIIAKCSCDGIRGGV